MIFETRVHGIPCQCEVTEDNEECFDFEVLDRRGRLAFWLAKYLTADDVYRIKQEYRLACQELEASRH